MKKIFIVLAMLTLAFSSTNNAQAQQPINPMREGIWIGSLGIGVGNLYGFSTSNSGFGMKLALENGIKEAGIGVIAVGGEFGYAANNQSEFDGIGKWNWKYNNFNIGARGSYHIGWDVEGLDTYIGLPVGLSIASWSTNTPYPTNNSNSNNKDTDVDLYMGFFIGGSYFFNENFGVNVEFGYTTTLFQVGVVYRFW